MNDNPRPLVFVRKTLEEDATPHGGGWKVAMADLMISMFALFLILWLIQILDTEDKEKLVDYFRNGGVLEVSGGEAVVQGFNSISPIDLPNVATSHDDADLHRVNDTSLIEGEVNSQQELELLAARVQEQLEKLNGTSSVKIKVTPQGLRLVIHDSEHGSMFVRGSSNLTYFYEDLLLGLAPIFENITNSVIITGHTDMSKYVGSKKTNWDLSSDRAGRARYYLERGGMPAHRVYKVSGFGDTRPINKADPMSSVNRRIELFVMTRSAKEEMDLIFDGTIDIEDQDNVQQKVSSEIERAKNTARANQR
ncbi:OmpA family protein [Vibrio alginolyticus]|nr:OmpA family protein [Vibrio alginolyticus]